MTRQNHKVVYARWGVYYSVGFNGKNWKHSKYSIIGICWLYINYPYDSILHNQLKWWSELDVIDKTEKRKDYKICIIIFIKRKYL